MDRDKKLECLHKVGFDDPQPVRIESCVCVCVCVQVKELVIKKDPTLLDSFLNVSVRQSACAPRCIEHEVIIARQNAPPIAACLCIYTYVLNTCCCICPLCVGPPPAAGGGGLPAGPVSRCPQVCHWLHGGRLVSLCLLQSVPCKVRNLSKMVFGQKLLESISAKKDTIVKSMSRGAEWCNFSSVAPSSE